MASFAAFALVAALLTITPGADMAMVTRVAVTRGFRPATRTAVGIASGTMLWAVLSAVGLAALIAASATAFNVLKLVGAAYLTFLGIQALLSSLRRGEPVAAPVERAVGSPYRMACSRICSGRARAAQVGRAGLDPRRPRDPLALLLRAHARGGRAGAVATICAPPAGSRHRHGARRARFEVGERAPRVEQDA
jgi:hypothetical protein